VVNTFKLHHYLTPLLWRSHTTKKTKSTAIWHWLQPSWGGKEQQQSSADYSVASLSGVLKLAGAQGAGAAHVRKGCMHHKKSQHW